MVTVQLLGGACLRSDDVPLAGPPAQRHRIALLTLVVAAWPRPLSRDRAMALLWPERDVGSARRLLNLAVHVLRSTLGDGAIVSTGDGLVLDPGRTTCDLHALNVAISAGDHDRVVRLYAGPLLDGFHLSDATEFDYWLDERRGALAHAYVGALLATTERQRRAGDAFGRVGTCHKLVAADPYSTSHALALMHALDDAGDRAGARHHAAEHARRLRVDLDVAPDPEIQSLAERLRAPAVARPSAPKLADRAASPCVAVLPFRRLSPSRDDDYFTDGITEDVIAHLSRIRALTVISRASVMRFRDREQSLQEIGAVLGASFVLDGSVRHEGGRVRMVATLVHAPSGQQLWADTYDRQLTDIFAIQTDVALRIAAALETALTHDEQTRLRRAPTTDLLAWQLLLQGRHSFIQYSPHGYLRAIEYYERAIARDPSFALAFAHRAMAYAELAESGSPVPDATYGRARDSAACALRLDAELAEAHCTMGYLKAVCEFDWPAAEQDFTRALDLSPSGADTYALYGRMCAGLGRYDEALALQLRAKELDPLAQRIDILTTLLRAGRYDDVVRGAEDAVAVDESYDRAHATLGWAYFLTGRQQEGLIELERAVSVSGENTVWLGQLGQAYAMAGDGAKARQILAELEDRAARAYVSPYHFAYLYTGLGDIEQAMDWLERAAAERTGPVYGIKGSFLLAPLRGHPRFDALLRTMNLA